MTRAHHSQSLDGLRFFAVAIVFLFHAYEFTPSLANFPLVRFGWLGVPIFFVLSGFLIGGILIGLKSRLDSHALPLSTALRVFYARRFLRLFPVYYVLLTVVLLLRASGHEPGAPEKSFSFVWHFFYLTNLKQFLASAWGGSESHFWSLSVEEHFYVLAPLMVLVVRPNRLAAVCAVIAALSIAYVFGLPFAHSARWYWILSPAYFAPLCMGVLCAIADANGAVLGLSCRAIVRVGAAAGAVVVFLALNRTTGWPLALFARDYPLKDLIGLATSVATSGLVLALWRGELALLGRALAAPPIAYLGKISYGMYLFHPYCLRWLPERYGPRFTVTNGLYAFATTVAVSVLSWHLLEGPVLKLKPTYPR